MMLCVCMLRVQMYSCSCCTSTSVVCLAHQDTPCLLPSEATIVTLCLAMSSSRLTARLVFTTPCCFGKASSTNNTQDTECTQTQSS